MQKKSLLGLAVLGLVAASTNTMAMGDNHSGEEKCYGVAKKGQNGCGNGIHGCHMNKETKHDGQANEWIYVPKGLCEKLSHGSLKIGPAPKKAPAKK